MTGMGTCKHCGVEMTRHGLKSHQKLHCPKRPALVDAQAAALKAGISQMEAMGGRRPPVLCECGCGNWVKQTSTKPKRFLTGTHYSRWKDAFKRKARKSPSLPALTAEERLARELDPIREVDALMRRAADSIPMLTGEAHYSLWWSVLGART